MCLSVCFPHGISKTTAAAANLTKIRSTTRPENPLIFGSKGQRSRGTKRITGVSHGALVNAGFFWLVVRHSLWLTYNAVIPAMSRLPSCWTICGEIIVIIVNVKSPWTTAVLSTSILSPEIRNSHRLHGAGLSTCHVGGVAVTSRSDQIRSDDWLRDKVTWNKMARCMEVSSWGVFKQGISVPSWSSRMQEVSQCSKELKFFEYNHTHHVWWRHLLNSFLNSQGPCLANHNGVVPQIFLSVVNCRPWTTRMTFQQTLKAYCKTT